jgi:hypothetical protein
LSAGGTGNGSGGAGRLLSAAVGVACGSAAGWLAAHHPLSPLLALVVCATLGGLTLRFPTSWAWWVLLLWPVAGLMPFTGWIAVEEFDLVVLSVAAGGWLRWAMGGPPSPPDAARARLWPAVGWLLPLTLSTALSTAHGVEDAGGLVLDWWQGYREPLNSLRLAKPLAEVLLLLPLWCRSIAPSRPGGAEAGRLAALQRLPAGMVGLLAVVALCVLWERLAYTGLLDFSSDYRVTGPFWEMHVGGAALDFSLAVGLPFAFAAVLRAATPWRWVVLSAVLALALYAALVTFSRIVYVAVPVGLLVVGVLEGMARPRPVGADAPQTPSAAAVWRPSMLALAAFTAAALALFPTAGYRGLLALWGAAVALLSLAGIWRGLSRSSRGLGMVLAIPAVAGVLAAAEFLSKGAYLAYGLSAVATLGFALVARGRPGGWAGPGSLGAFVGMLAGCVAVAVHWGGAAALGAGLAVALTLGALGLGASLGPRPLWPDGWRWQAQTAGVWLAAAALVGVFSGGAYMGKRWSDASQESVARRAHWQSALDLVGAGDAWLGLGLGRFASLHAWSGRPEDRVGDYRLLPRGDRQGIGTALVMSSGGHALGYGEILRVAQRVALPAPGPVRLRLELRSEGPSQLVFEVCERHLLYPLACVSAAQEVAARPGWQSLEVLLKGETLTGGRWFAPRLAAFAIGLDSRNSRIVVDRLSLVDSQGRELLVNGDFEDGLSHWFFTSDRWHLPWHAKNLAVHLMVEQGWLGLGAFALMTVVALWRVSLGAARRHSLAPPLAGAILAACVVGGIDSLLDMPRVAFLMHTLWVAALLLPGTHDPRFGRASR